MIGSNTKAFTATALALLEAEGKLSLNDKVNKYLPDFTMKDKWVEKELNLTDIVTHRMGLATFQGDFMYWTSDLTSDEVITKFGMLTPLYGFREKYGYTNAGYAIAGKIIKTVTDTSWSNFLSSRIFNPLNMTRTLAISEDYFNVDNAAKPHTFVNDNLTVLPFKSIDNLAPAGSIGSSVMDLSRWMMMQLDNGKYLQQQIIPEIAIKKTRQPFTIIGRSRHQFNKTHFSLYGLGWALDDYEGREIVSHTRGVNGFVTSVTLVPEENLGIVILTNTDQNLFYLSLKLEIIDSYLNLAFRNYDDIYYNRFSVMRDKNKEKLTALRDTAYMDLKPEIDFQDFTGRYTNEIYGYLDISWKDSFLEMTFEHHSGLTGKLESLGGSRFLCTYSDPTYGIVVIPFEISDGKVKSLTLSVDEFVERTTYKFVKME